jgi:hypothetical protein
MIRRQDCFDDGLIIQREQKEILAPRELGLNQRALLQLIE